MPSFVGWFGPFCQASFTLPQKKIPQYPWSGRATLILRPKDNQPKIESTSLSFSDYLSVLEVEKCVVIDVFNWLLVCDDRVYIRCVCFKRAQSLNEVRAKFSKAHKGSFSASVFADIHCVTKWIFNVMSNQKKIQMSSLTPKRRFLRFDMNGLQVKMQYVRLGRGNIKFYFYGLKSRKGACLQPDAASGFQN
jgi:hypothetical protein